MKFLRLGQLGQEKPAILDSQGNFRDLSAYLPDISGKFFTGHITQQLQQTDLSALPLIDPAIRLGSCIGPIGKIICIGFNSQSHVREMGRAHQSEPIVFMKPTSALAGANDAILFTRYSKQLDWEAELAIVIGKQGKYIAVEEAQQYVFGYACFNDLTERTLQFGTEDKQFTKGKCFDGAAVLGPYLVTKDEVADADNLQIQLWVNGALRQDFNTKDYIHNHAQVISYVSQYFTLYPGDVISMGSGPGSAVAWDSHFLKPGDQVTLHIEGLGEQRQTVVPEPK